MTSLPGMFNGITASIMLSQTVTNMAINYDIVDYYIIYYIPIKCDKQNEVGEDI